MDERGGREVGMVLGHAVRSVIDALRVHGATAIHVAERGGPQVRRLGGDAPDGAPVAAEVPFPDGTGALQIVAPQAPSSAVDLAATALTAILEGERIERDARAAAARFEALVAAAPDAIVVVGSDGRVTAVNRQAVRLFGYTEDEFVGLEVDRLLPVGLRERHGDLREGYIADARPRPMAAGRDLEALRADGSAVPVDIGLTPIAGDHGPSVAAFVRDATPRRQAEADRQHFAEGRMRRRQALELNDTVVQGLVALLWRLDDGGSGEVRRIAENTLAAARRIMADLLDDDLDELDPDHLVRSEHASTRPAPPAFTPADAGPPAAAVAEDTRTLLIADDAADLRHLLRFRFDRAPRLQVVAEAEDGQQAVDLALQHAPDVILLDLSMPVLDGLEAARRIRDGLPGCRIVVLSGYPKENMAKRALAAGADVYCEKSTTLDEVYEAVTGAAVSSA